MSKEHLSKVPYIEQMQQTECGLCCLAMVLQYYKSQDTLAQIRDELDVGRDGMKLSQMYAYVKRRGMCAKVFSCGMNSLKNLPLPAILFWNNQHYVVLEKVSEKRITVVDPALGRMHYDYEEFEQCYSNVVMMILPTDEFERKREKRNIWGSLLREAIIKRKLFYITAAITLVAYGLQLLLSVLIEKIFDNGSIVTEANSLQNYLAIALGVGIAFSVTAFIRKQSQIRLQVEVDRHLSEGTFNKMLKLPYQFFERRTNGDLLFRLNCLPVIRDLLSDNVMNGVIQAGFSVIILAYLTAHSTILTATALGFFIANGLFVAFMRKRIIEANQVQIIENTRLQSLQVETVQSIFNIKTSGIEQEFFTNWLSKYLKGMKAFQVKNKIYNLYSTILMLFQLIGPFTVLWIGMRLSGKGVMTMGQAIASYSLANTFFGSALSLFHMWNDFTVANSYLERVDDILASGEEKNEGHIRIEQVNSLEFKGVSMSYTKNGEKVLSDINLKINSGEKIALVGRSGSGKSSLIKLMLGLYVPSEGQILINGVDSKEIDIVSYRKSMGIVPQDIYLFNKSVLENIRMNNSEITEEEVVEAAKIARIHDEIDQMPMKYRMVVSNMGMNLSGGQRQRIALARAIVSKKKFMVLDEATSSLDNVNEQDISDYFAKNGCTQVIAAHRLSTIENADRILVLDKGRIVEEGKHEDLLSQNGIYAELYYSKDERGEKNA